MKITIKELKRLIQESIMEGLSVDEEKSFKEFAIDFLMGQEGLTLKQAEEKYPKLSTVERSAIAQLWRNPSRTTATPEETPFTKGKISVPGEVRYKFNESSLIKKISIKQLKELIRESLEEMLVGNDALNAPIKKDNAEKESGLAESALLKNTIKKAVRSQLKK